MADVRDITVEILKQIRDEVRSTREALSTRLESIDGRLTHVEASMVEVRDSTADMAAQQRVLARHAEVSMEREARMERELLVLRSRVDAIEARLPPAGGGAGSRKRE